MPSILACDRISEAGLSLLRPRAEVIEAGALAEDALIEALHGCDALIVRSATKVTARVFESAPALRVVARAGVGIDNIDVDAATRSGVLVLNSPAGNTLAAAEHTVAMILAAARNIPQAAASMKAGNFDRKSFMGRQVSGKTLGVIGLGKIGAEVARRAAALGMNLVAHDPYCSPEQADKLGAKLATIPEVLAAADFLTVHAALTDETRGLIGVDELRQMRPEAILVNCARGGIVDEAALLAALDAKQIAGAALDVWENEPNIRQDLALHPLVIATPHLGASTAEAQETVAIDVAEQIRDVLDGKPPRSPVNVPAVSPELLAELQPFLALATKLGELARVLVTSAPRGIAVSASETAPAAGLPLLAGKLIAVALAGRVDVPLNEVNAMYVARELGIQVSHTVSTRDRGYGRHLEAEVALQDGTCRLTGAVIEGTQPRILSVNGFSLDLEPEGQYILIWKRDPRVPGFIGRIGSTLAEAGVGISSIQVGREVIGDLGLLVARLDQTISPEVRASIMAYPDVVRLEQVAFA